MKTKKPKEPLPVPEKATSCMMTSIPKSAGVFWTPGIGYREKYYQPTALVLYFDGFGLRRVYINQRGQHCVKINRRHRRVDIATMSLIQPKVPDAN